MRPAGRYLRSTLRRTIALGAGIAAAAAVFTVLAMNAVVPVLAGAMPPAGMSGAPALPARAPLAIAHFSTGPPGLVPSHAISLEARSFWYPSAADATVARGLDSGVISLALLLLAVAAAYFANGVRAALHGRRRELATLRALGWRAGQIRGQLLREVTVVALAGGMLAVLAVSIGDAVVDAQLPSWWTLLGLPASAAAAFAASWLPVWRTAAAVMDAPTGHEEARRIASTAGSTVRNSAPAVLVIAIACTALGQELTVRWAFGGFLTGSVLGRPLVWQADTTDIVAAIAVLAMAVIATADLLWLNAGERALQTRTLRAIGHSASGLARRAVRDAALSGLAGGLIASAAAMTASLAIAHRVPGRVLAVMAAVAAIGMLASLLAVGLAAALGRRTGLPR
jgi:putative ABC transport system permease protein